jgi:hypothetical protein
MTFIEMYELRSQKNSHWNSNQQKMGKLTLFFHEIKWNKNDDRK